MAQDITVAREGGVESLNGVSSGGRQTPRLYGTADTERYPKSVSLGISTRDGSARKDKAIVDQERKDFPSTGKWNATNQSELQYMRDGVTVADAYSLYKRLKG